MDPYSRTSNHQWRRRQSDHARNANGEQQVQVGEGHREFHHPPLSGRQRGRSFKYRPRGQSGKRRRRVHQRHRQFFAHCKNSCYSPRLGCLLPYFSVRDWPMCWFQTGAHRPNHRPLQACAADCHCAWHRLRSPAWIHITPKGPPPHLADLFSLRPAHSPALSVLQPVCRTGLIRLAPTPVINRSPYPISVACIR